MSVGPADSSTITSLLVAVGGALGIEVVKRYFARPKEAADEASAFRNELRGRYKDLVDENQRLREERDKLRAAHDAATTELREAKELAALDAKGHAAAMTAAHQQHVAVLSAKEADIAALTEENGVLAVRASDLQTQLRSERKRCYDLERQLKLKR